MEQSAHHLAVIDGPDPGWVLPLAAGTASIGRGEGAKLRINDSRLSREHFLVRAKAGRVRVADHGSANGTWVRRAARSERGAFLRSKLGRPKPAGKPHRWRWQQAGAGAQIYAGTSTFALRAHPGAAAIAEAGEAEPGGNSGGSFFRLLFPLLMAASLLSWLARSGSTSWRIVLYIAIPLVLIAVIAVPLVRRWRSRKKQDEDPDRSRRLRHQPWSDPAAFLASAGARVAVPESGLLWEVGNANRYAPLGRARGRKLRLRHQLRWLDVPRPGQAVALVGAREDIEALTRWVLVRHTALTAEPVRASLPHLRGLIPPLRPAGSTSSSQSEIGRAEAVTLWDADVRIDAHTRPAHDCRHLVLSSSLAAVPSWCGGVIEVRESHNRRVQPAWAQAAAALMNARDEGGQLPERVLLHDLLEDAGSVAGKPTGGAKASRPRPAGSDRSPAGGPSPAGSLPRPGRSLPNTGPGSWIQPAELAPNWAGTGGDRVGEESVSACAAEELTAPLGRTSDSVVWVDLAAQGPHALVAGTTGAGKSELLISWVLALAWRYSPSQVQFALFDYKGGATFGPLARMAHVAGVLTDLDEAATARALKSLQAELRAREEALARVGANSFAEQNRRAEPQDRLPRLVVVVDEFRVLADSHPDQLAALVRLAAQGRSLGIHLILATQRPAGAITPDMRANMTVRVCLRVIEEIDSTDVIGSKRAAQLPRIPGRAVIKVDEEVEVQGPWCGPATDALSWAKQINSAAHRWAQRRPGWNGPSQIWAPALASHYDLDDLEQAGELAACGRPESAPPAAHEGTPWAMADLPEQQQTAPVSLPPGVTLVWGSAGSGKTSALATAAEVGLRSGYCVHVLAEGGNHWPGHEAGAAGTWCSLTQVRQIVRLIEMLLAAPDAAAATAQPTMVVIDDIDALIENLDDVLGTGLGEDLLVKLLRRSRRSGVDIFFSASARIHRWAPISWRQLMLCPRDVADAMMLGAPREMVATTWPPGRGVLIEAGKATLVQLGQATPTPTRWSNPAKPVLRIEALPAGAQLAEAPSPTGLSGQSQAVILGRGGDDASWQYLLPEPGQTWTITGPSSSGKTAVLNALVKQFAALDWHIIIEKSTQTNRDAFHIRDEGQDAHRGDGNRTKTHTAPSGGAPTVVIADDFDLGSSHDHDRIAATLGAHPQALLIGCARSDALAGIYHEVGARLRQASTQLVLTPSRPPHLGGRDLRKFCDTDGLSHPGRGVLLQGRQEIPMQFVTIGATAESPQGPRDGAELPARAIAARL